MRFGNQSGSSVTEAAIAVAFLALLFGGGLATAYLIFARVWLERSSYEATICLSTRAPIRECRRQFEGRFHAALPIGTLEHLRMFRSTSETRIDLRFRIGDHDVLRLSRKQRLPLIAMAVRP